MASLTAPALVVSLLPLRLHGMNAALMRSEQFDSDCAGTAGVCKYQLCKRKTCNQWGDTGDLDPKCLTTWDEFASDASLNSIWVSDGCEDFQAVRWITTEKYWESNGWYLGTNRDPLPKCDIQTKTPGSCYQLRHLDDFDPYDVAGRPYGNSIGKHQLNYFLMAKRFPDTVKQCPKNQCQINWCKSQSTCNKYVYDKKKCVKKREAMKRGDLPDTGFLWMSRGTWFSLKLYFSRWSRFWHPDTYGTDLFRCNGQNDCRFYIELADFAEIGCISFKT